MSTINEQIKAIEDAMSERQKLIEIALCTENRPWPVATQGELSTDPLWLGLHDVLTTLKSIKKI